MKTNLKLALAMFLTVITAGAQSAPTLVSVSAAAMTPGIGYGVDADKNKPEDGGTLLDVQFLNTFISASGTLSAVNDWFEFKIGTVNFNEPDTGDGNGNVGIRKTEDDDLGVSASFTLTSPIGTSRTVTALGTVVLGEIGDSSADYSINWSPVEVHFGLNNSGIFSIDLSDLTFNDVGIQDQAARITLLQLESEAVPGNAVPEPGSLSLLTFGFVGYAIYRRRKPIAP
jgi:hypothetical protein